MAFETGLQNKPTPIGLLGQASGRLVKEDNFVVNAADLLAQIVDPVSGLDINVNISTSPTSGAGVADNTQVSKTLFSAGFDGGFDTFYDWSFAFNGALRPATRNDSVVNGNDHVGPVNFPTSTLPIRIDCAGAPGTVYDMYSNNYLKMGSFGKVVAYLGGGFQNRATTTNPTYFEIRVVGDLAIEQDQWNVDTFDGSQDTGNPSKIDLDFENVQCVVIEFYNKSQGDLRIGFLIEDKVFYAHIYTSNNARADLDLFSSNLPIRDTVYRDASQVVREIGVFDNQNGVSFISRMDIQNDPTLVATYFTTQCSVKAVGDQKDSLRKPFDYRYDGGGGVVEYKTLSDENSSKAIISIRPKPEIYAGVVNRTVYSIGEIVLGTRSLDLNASAIFYIYFNSVTVGTFLPISIYSGLEATSDVTGLNIDDSILLKSIVVSGNDNVVLKEKNIFDNTYYNSFSRKSIDYAGSGVTENVVLGTILIMAKPTSGTSSIEVCAAVSGFETA